ncbi:MULTISPECIES: signal peptide peptidase SppA [unclassified Acinetobacter]|uniref:signal peptide peptidase SppA n=1 Tax=unclassified Acinetobacter TaxID=196816 RepID=UPI0035B7470B
MSDWPPQPNNNQSNNNHVPQPQQQGQQPTGQEWKILEKAVLSSVEEQRRARRWGIFFKLLTFCYLLVVVLLMSRSCSTGAGLNSSKKPNVNREHLAVVSINGTISNDSKSVNSADTNEAIRDAFEASNSKAIILEINSPGGSPVQSDEIWQEIRYQKTKFPEKKVYAVVGDIGASGAYYIASAADEIYVNRSSIIGSIGVIMPNYNVEELMRKVGVQDRTMTAGEHKNILSMSKPIDEFEKQHVQAMLDNVHSHFIDAVKTGRGSRLSTDPKIFSGLFWSGEQAIKLGIADKVGSVDTLSRELKIDRVVDYTVKHNPLDSILGMSANAVGQGIGQSLKKEIQSNNDVSLK